jgi:small subunit ribosomal protein S14
MAKTSVVARNDKRKRLVAKYAAKRAELKAAGDMVGLQKLPRNSARVRVQSRCSMTGRARGVYRKFGLARNMFRQLALEGKIPGVRKSSW